MKKILVFLSFIFLITSCGAFAETLPDETAVKSFVTKVMSKIASAQPDQAFEIIKPFSTLSASEIDSIVIQSKPFREQYNKKYGATTGYEFIDMKKVGTCLLRLRYIEKTEKNAFFWIFYFYRSKEGWILSGFYWNVDYSQIFV